MKIDKDAIKQTVVESVLTTASEQGADVIKAQVGGVVAGLITDTAASMIPGFGGAITSIRHSRLKKNVEEIERLFNERIEEIQHIFYSKNQQQREDIDKLFEFMVDGAITEPQVEKIEYFINGFVNIAAHEEIKEDFILLFYDTLKELRLIDLTVLKLYGRFYLKDDQNHFNSYQDVLDQHGISYEQYELIRRNLVRKGILTTKTNTILEKDLEAIEDAINTMQKYLQILKGEKKGSYPRLKQLKLKSKDNLEITKFGREFILYIINTNDSKGV